MLTRIADCRGNIVVTFALAAPILIGLVGSAFDFSRYGLIHNNVQFSADAAAIAAAREIFLGGEQGYKKDIAKAVATDVARRHLQGQGYPGEPVVEVDANLDDRTISVSVAQPWEPTLLSEVFGAPARVLASAVAEAQGTASVCVIALEPKQGNAIKTDSRSELLGNGCAFFANSTATNAIRAERTFIQISADLICSGGGYQGGPQNIKPVPLTDCPPKDDPLSDRVEPKSGGCDETALVVDSKSLILYPGVYCNGLHITGTSAITLKPGLYVLRDGDLTIGGQAEVKGEYVSFFFETPNSDMTIGPNTSLSLTAQRDGPLAGVLLFQTRSGADDTKFRISSNDARRLVGTIYVPRGTVDIDASAPVADESAYTAIVADKLRLGGSARVVLNTNYSDTDVPAPEGVVAKPDIALRK